MMRGLVYSFLDGANGVDGKKNVRFQPNPRHVNEVLDCLKTGLALPVDCRPRQCGSTLGDRQRNGWLRMGL